MAHESQGDDLHRQQEPARGNEAVCAQRQQGSAAGCGPEARMDAHIASLAVGISAVISAWHWPHVRLYRPAAVPFVELRSFTKIPFVRGENVACDLLIISLCLGVYDIIISASGWLLGLSSRSRRAGLLFLQKWQNRGFGCGR